MAPLVWLLPMLSVGAAADVNYCNIDSCVSPLVSRQDHTLCQFPTNQTAPQCGTVVERGVSSGEREEILTAHNTIRRDVKTGRYADKNLPAAKEMPDLKWDDELATVAQRWADQCQEVYNDECRDAPGFKVGQSITVSKGPSESKNWTDTIVNSWFLQELSDFKKEQKDLMCCSAFTSFRLTQIIWANTTNIGCGFIGVKSENSYPVERTDRTYICNYGPTGNKLGESIYQKA